METADRTYGRHARNEARTRDRMMHMDINAWFADMQKKLAIDVEEVGLSRMHDWQVVSENGAAHHIAHISGKFHRGVFLKAWDKFRNEWVERFLLAPIPPEGGEAL